MLPRIFITNPIPHCLTRLFLTIVFLFTLFSVPLFPIAPAQAAPTCHTTADHTVCILSIKRSAKNYWEYRAAVNVDGHVFPVEVYDCRDRTKTTRKGQVIPFEPNGAGTVICQLLYRG